MRVPESMHSCLAELNVFNLAGRYPDALPALPTQEQAEAMFSAAKETRRWLKGKL
ncbi:MAG: HEPN domain-containing protein [Acidobacteriota bacterium]